MERLASGTVLGDRYVLHDVVGSGGMAAVWHATDRVLDRPVAVKILHARLAEDPAFLDRFRAEATASARLTHPNIVNVFDTGADGLVAFIVMEMFDGETLRERLTRQGPMEPGEAAAIMVQVLSALQFAHDNGLVHRDVKPANVLVSPDGRVKVTDFGIAKAAYEGADPTTTGQVLGSVPYLSPEQVEGEPVDARSDVYGAGIMLYELLTGRTPFHAETEIATAMMRLTNEPTPPRAIRAGIPRPLEAVVLRALARDPDARFASASDMAGALSRLHGSAATVSLPRVAAEPEPAHPGGGFFRSWMVVPLLAILVAAVVIVIGLLTQTFQLGGKFGIEPKGSSKPRSSAPPSDRVLDIVGVPQSVDPFGDDSEHDEDLRFATDGDPGTFWQTEGYNSEDLDKPGVGIAFDLGTPREVDGFELESPLPGWEFEIRVGDDLEAMPDQTGERFTAGRSMSPAIEPATGRFVLVWITHVVPAPDGQNRAEISEFSVLGPGG